MSEQDRIAFEAWYDNDISEPLPDDYTILGKRYLYMGWQAATAEANKRIAELESEVSAFEAISFVQMKQIDELQASNKVLREALENIVNTFYEETDVAWMRQCYDLMESGKQTLSTTPAESLQAK